MNRAFLALLFFFVIPSGIVHAASAPASFSAAQSLVAASSSPGNAYLAGASVVVTAPVVGDLSAIGGGIVVAAPVAGDGLIFAGSVSSRASVAGDLRTISGSVTIEKPVAGDMVALGLSVSDLGHVGRNVFIAALNASLLGGASGPVVIYGNNVSLAGDFAGDVTVIASGHLTIAADTIIRGTLSYESPEEAAIPVSASISHVEYKNVTYLPSADTSRVLGFISTWVFLVIRIFGLLLLAGLLAGLFPMLSHAVVSYIDTKKVKSILLTFLLGFALVVATPILCVMLALTFVGIGVALLLGLAYLFILLLAVIYAGILLGGIFARRYLHREIVFWSDGVLGMLALSLVSLIPYAGLFIALFIAIFVTGALARVFSDFAFSNSDTDTSV